MYCTRCSDFTSAFESALAAATLGGLNLAMFDGNNDGYIDIISVLHRYLPTSYAKGIFTVH